VDDEKISAADAQKIIEDSKKMYQEDKASKVKGK
jgi:hypothetical protein